MKNLENKFYTITLILVLAFASLHLLLNQNQR